MTHSMTGFARTQREYAWGVLSCEIRSVNHRYLEPSFRLPDSLRAIEATLRDQLKNQLGRGKVEITFFTQQAQSDSHRVDEAALQALAQLLATAEHILPNVAPVNPLEALRWPGVLQAQELDGEQLAHAAQQMMGDTLTVLQASRAREGASLAQHIQARLQSMSTHVKALRAQMPNLVAAQQAKLSQKIMNLQVEVDNDRLAQELVIIAQKADVTEELDRLDTHIAEAQHTLKQAGSIGRRLDFLMQEFNREANTLSSKAITGGVTQVAVELKVLIEQMREQIQNIE
ncbi:YicC/YloC family endoribonuclease [Marinagarivorans algicola]|uniref:YicC/YloC family endoribonuclease n=1 Tax=Marinagarivorans algicola TaxID=1513270 RepID=UPI0006B5BA94|nr:YicC/YloC family endoribonuclease [Marinagarivorans algicola]